MADGQFKISVSLTPTDFRAINRLADLKPGDGKARSAYLLGCALQEPRPLLLERVHAIRDAERARFRAADRASLAA